MRIVNSTETGFKIYNKTATKSEIIIYAGIGKDYWGDGNMFSAKQFSEELAKIPATVNEIEVRINSPGGDVFDGMTIYNRLKQHKAKKKIYIDGLCASIASIIALAGDEIVMGEGALYMIHLPWTYTVGNRVAHDETTNRLMNIEEQMLGIYAKRSGMDKEEIRALLVAETWLDSEQTIEYGFADSKMEDTVPIAASVLKSKWINKRPEKFVSKEDAVKAQINELKNKVSARIARK